jgi:ADP-heptose:LPS heptosyltransferase
MCLPVLAAIKQRNPACRITWVSRYPEVFSGMAGLDAVELYEPGKSADVLELTYGPEVPPKRPLITHLAECVGLELPSQVPPLPPLAPAPALRSEIDALPRPRVIIQPRASRWTPVKNWPLPNWIALVRQLVEHCTVIEVGTEPAFADCDFGPHFHSFAGRTSLTDFMWLIGQGEVFVGPSSGGMHIAAAHGLQSVIIFGGYERPEGYQYPRTTTFYRQVECAPCWRSDDCPYELKCMQQVAPDEVFAAVRRALESHSERSGGGQAGGA